MNLDVTDDVLNIIAQIFVDVVLYVIFLEFYYLPRCHTELQHYKVERVVDKTSSHIPRLEEMLSLCVPTNHRKAISSCNLAAIFVETCVQVLQCRAFCDDFYGEDAVATPEPRTICYWTVDTRRV